ncbi:MAG: AAA family ATPase [Leptospiraceae bacterium]|nr:AAA family ATPase [Leptospiraceae bacterium]MCP5503001.1 AAA family ATPase [Leptospiraceae bacterium]
MKRLPLGIQTFADIIEENHYYVDKTEFVYKLAYRQVFLSLSAKAIWKKSVSGYTPRSLQG